ncbi:MAG: hypothetical protein A2Z11_00950 [Candidatus Woykebacteria bacterium RBG_16_43_9]|uniref:50S ribosomal protein L7/L12 n=1 Tax=Candidatus Woykebacteria bacterium RBG_16_43_9 TaxID=1802596 RepID=A0A1G1WH87_9BACT|nr:MAG: hypothetical protein A2Z11_00950 [Candidatus Woykebacteria bacterium RBG_16_43_9]
MATNKIDLIRQALSAAESSIKLARQLLSEIEIDGRKDKPKAKELPGTAGIFDGQSMVTEKGEKYPVPENYASKSILVVGDTLKLVEGGGEKRFKQIEHVKRHKTYGIIAKKDGKWAAVTSEGSYRLLPAAVDHFKGDVGDEVLIQLPANNLQTSWGAVEKITKKGGEAAEEKQDSETKDHKNPFPPKSEGVKKEETETKAKPKKENTPETKKEDKEKASEETTPKTEETPVATEAEEKQPVKSTQSVAEDELS